MVLDVATRLTAAALLCVSITACSVANYRKPIEDFAQATRDTQEALVSLDKQLTDAQTDVIRRRVLARGLQAAAQSGDCLTNSERCRMIARDKEGATRPLVPASPMPKTLLLMNSIRSYADGLAAIVNADTASQVTTQVSATIASVKSLATTVAKLGGPDSTSLVKLGDYATPVGNLFSWGAGQYIAKLQLEGLRRATADARPVLSGAAELFETISNEASFPTRALLAEEVRQRTDALRTNLNQRNVEELAASAARYDRVLLGGPAPVFRQLRQSHDALIGKIQDENVTLAEVIERIQAFAAEAQKLAAVVKEIEAIGKKKAEG